MDIQKEKNLYLAKLLEQEVIKQDEFEDLVFKPEINAFHSNYLSSRFMDNINFGWSAWQAATAQVVLEKDAIIQKLSDQLYAQEMKTSGARVLCETACELLDGYAHQDAMVILNDLEQAMKEPTND